MDPKNDKIGGPRVFFSAFRGRATLLAATLVVSLLTFVIAAALNVRAQEGQDRATERLIAVTQVAGEMRVLTGAMFADFGPAVIEGRTDLIPGLEQTSLGIGDAMARLGAAVSFDPQLQALYAELEEMRKPLVAWEAEMYALARAGDTDAVMAILQDPEYLAAANEFNAEFDALLAGAERSTERAYELSSEAETGAMAFALLGIAVMVILWTAILLDWVRQTISAQRAGGALSALNAELEDRVEERTRELNAALVRAEQASKAKSEFLATMSHELRTPLNGVLGMTTVLSRTELDERQSDMLGVIEASGKSLLSLLNDVLDYARLEAGRLELRSEPFDFAELVERVAEKRAPEAERKGLDFQLRIAPEARAAFIGDEVRVAQILDNLLSNAVKFTNEGGVEVTAGQTDGEISVSVRDTGCGVTPEQIENIFERFSQADNSASRRHGGAGLGLSLARELLNAMGGEIGLESTPGEGSEFWFRIPLERWTPAEERAAGEEAA